MKIAGKSMPHESAVAHVTGAALYTDDLAGRFPGTLCAWPVLAPHAHALVARLDVSPALRVPGVVTTLTAADVPGENDSGPSRHDEPIFPTEVMHHKQAIAWVLAEDLESAKLGAAMVVAEFEPLPAIVTIEEAIAAGSFHSPEPVRMRRGDFEAAYAQAAVRFTGEIEIGGQEQFYLETQNSLAWIDESGAVALHSSTQHPSETQEIVARALGVAKNQVSVECLRMGGAFGGKETQANAWAAVAALGTMKTRRPVAVRLPRVLDMVLTGKRHPFFARFAAGFSTEGTIEALRVEFFSDGGWSLDLSDPILSRALFHVDNAYYLPNVELTGRVCKTHKTSQTAFRGFGGPQGMLVIEDVLDRAARLLGLPPETVRQRNFYREGDCTHYGQLVKDASRIETIWTQLKVSSAFAARRAEIDAFNKSNRWTKCGLAITPAKFGISFTATFFNQAGALVIVYRDGSVQVNHGGTEMGQGLHTKIRQIAAECLDVDLERVRVMAPRTDKVPNTSATAASAGTDLNGAAVADACRQLCERLAPYRGAGTFAETCEAAYKARVPLFAQGYYRTPEIHWDAKTGQGKPFHYYAYGAAVSEVKIDGFTGDYQIRRVDILEDVGDSLSPLIDRGQVEGGFIQGLGWLTIEELLWDSQGRLATNSASTYKLPSWSAMPAEFNVAFLERATEPGVILGSKAVGEPPLMLAISVREALRDAVAAFGARGVVEFESPATPERVYWAIERARSGKLTMAEVNALGCGAFVERVGWVFEDSPWVAERCACGRPFADREALHAAMSRTMREASTDEQLALLRAHPDLGARARMSAASVNEQAGAGLDSLTAEEFERLHALNAEYKQKFGFPFLYAVKGSTKHDILEALAQRLPRTVSDEFQEALTQVERIAGFRLEELIDGTIR